MLRGPALRKTVTTCIFSALCHCRYEAELIPDVVTAQHTPQASPAAMHDTDFRNDHDCAGDASPQPHTIAAAAAAAQVTPQSHYMPVLEPVARCHPSLLPTEEWQREVLAAFVDVRQYLQYWEAEGVGSKVNTAHPSQVCQLLLAASVSAHARCGNDAVLASATF